MQHTDKLAKGHTSVSMNYGLNKFHLNKLFFGFYQYRPSFGYLFPVWPMSHLAYNQQPSKYTPSLLQNEMVRYSAHQKKYCIVIHQPGKKYITYGAFLPLKIWLYTAHHSEKGYHLQQLHKFLTGDMEYIWYLGCELAWQNQPQESRSPWKSWKVLAGWLAGNPVRDILRVLRISDEQRDWYGEGYARWPVLNFKPTAWHLTPGLVPNIEACTCKQMCIPTHTANRRDLHDNFVRIYVKLSSNVQFLWSSYQCQLTILTHYNYFTTNQITVQQPSTLLI